MQLMEDWHVIKRLFNRSFNSSFHYAIASINEEGEPHVTPIGSLLLGEPGKGIYFDEFIRQLSINLQHNPKVCVLAVNSNRWFWIRSLFGGRFHVPPAIRLYGTVGNRREATETEIKLWQRRVRWTKITKGYALLWKNMRVVRDINFSRVEPVNIGAMTQDSN